MKQVKFWSGDPARSAEKIKQLWPRRAAEVIATADDIMEGVFTFQDHWEMECCPEPVRFGPDPKAIQWGLIPYGDQEWLFAFNRHTIFLNLAKAWLFTGEEKYLVRLAALWEDWIDRNPLTPENEGNIWRSLEAGLRCEFWLRTLCLVGDHPLLSDRLREKIRSCLLLHGEYLVRKSADFQKFSNWGVLQDHGLFLLGVWFRRQDWMDLAAQRLDLELHRQILNDGCHWEHSPMYHCEVLHCAMDALHIAVQNQIAMPARLRRNVHSMCRALMGMVTPDGVLMLQGDSDAIHAGNELSLGALLFADGQLRNMAGSVPYPENLWDLGEVAFNIRDLPSQPLDIAISQPDSGNVMLRENRQPDSAYFHFYCGPLGGGHGHADQLHIDAGIGSEPFLTDCGRYTYMDCPLRMELKAPAAHNTTTVDDSDFTVGVDTWAWNPIATPIKTDARITEDAAFLSGHHLGYLDRGVAVGREILWLRKWKVAVIFDEFFSGSRQEHSYQQHFHFGKGEISLLDNRLTWKGQTGTAQLICLGDVRCELGTSPFSHKYNVLSRCQSLTVRRSGSGFSHFLTVVDLDAETPLAVSALPVCDQIRPMENDPMVQALELARGEEKATVLMRCDEATPPRVMLKAGGHDFCGRAVFFDRDNPDGLCLAW